MRVYVDSLAEYFTFDSSINAVIWMSPGSHTLTVMAEDKKGYISATIIHVNISSQPPTVISDIQNMLGWLSFAEKFAAGSGRDGRICAAGIGNAVSTMTEDQSSPPMDGKSAKFSIGGPTGYFNELYWNPIGGGNNVSHLYLPRHLASVRLRHGSTAVTRICCN
jgi:hypothetical protein